MKAAVDLLDGGATVPFVARYRKEATGGLDDAQLRTLEERLRYLRELEDRRAAILESIEAQGKLDDELRARILAADSKARLEDIYLPFKPKRRTKAQIAREAGLEPLAVALLADPGLDPSAAAAGYVDADKGVADAAAALDGARAILAEHFAEDADLIGALRERLWATGGLDVDRAAGPGGGGGQVRRLLRLLRAVHPAPVPPHPGAVPGREGGGPRRRRRRRRTRRLRGPHRRRASAWRSTCAGRATRGWPRPCGGRGRRGSPSTSASTSAAGCGRRPRTGRCGSSPPTSVTCCWPPRPGAGPRWASTRDCGPA